MSMSFDMEDLPLAQERDNGLSANECSPQELVNDPSFALLNRDPYVIRHGVNELWAVGPTPQLINGRNPPFRKRDLSYLNPNEYVLEENNSSRRLGQDEFDLVAEAIALDEHLRMLDEQMHEVAAYVDCVGDDCATSTTLISEASMTLLPSTPTGTTPNIVNATATAVNIPLDPARVKQSVALARSGPILPAAPEVSNLA